jgi:sodium-dependent phosphate cotransporter
VYLLLVGVSLVGAGFKIVSGGTEGALEIFSFASNPLVGVILGVLATALVQSSSTVSSVIVGLVAGGVPVTMAVPMIMGANMGTTITNTIVSLGNLGDKTAFKRSFQAATVHDFFNLFSIFIFLPIEMLFKPLERSALALSELFARTGGASPSNLNFVGAMTKPVANFLTELTSPLPFGGYIAIVIGIALIMASVILLGKVLQTKMTGKARDILTYAVGRDPLTGVASGTAMTVLVQSSSTTTSLVVPLAGAGVLTTKQVFPFTMGANIGTCITALLAATGANQPEALQIALVHLLYNVFGVVLFLVVPWLKTLPVRSAEWLGELTERNRAYALVYLLLVFFVLPGVVLGITDLLDSGDLMNESDSEVISETARELEEEDILLE